MTARIGWKGSVAALGAALVLVGAGIALAKPHEGHGGHGHGKGHEDGHDAGRHGEAGKPGGGGPGKGRGACDAAAVGAVLAAVDAACPCAGAADGTGGTVPWRNHGAYVRCVSHGLRDGVRTARIKRRCVRDVVPCAARSACGKNGAIACVVTTTGTCASGACSNDPGTTCVADADCATRACSVTTAADCTAAGGAAASGSCCTGSPSGAFLE
jgi:hypothetical protein